MVTHHHLAFKRTYRFKRHADNDQYRCTAKLDLKSGYQAENDREYRDYSEEYRSDKRDLVERIIYKVRCGLSRTVAGDSAVVLF